MNRLEPILARTREDLATRKSPAGRRAVQDAVQERQRAGDRRSFLEAVRRPGLSLIAEHKRRSPSAGAIREDTELEEVVLAYEQAGAAALSILTEPHSFGGSLDDLRRARSVSRLPLLRKDFTIDPFQIAEAFAAGADAILLIVAALDADQLSALHDEALGLGLAALVEVHDRAEIEVALSAGAEVIGINNRDLSTLEVDLRRTFSLLEELPRGLTVVAESGFSRREELLELERAGVDGVLIGEALMRRPDIAAATKELLTARR